MSQEKAPPAPSSTQREPVEPASPHRALLRAALREKVAEETFSHPFNPDSKIFARTLSDATGLERIGIHWVRVPAGKESFVYHRHRMEEEFVYILSGRGVAEIDGEEHEVGPGDFMGFGTSPPVGHHLRNPFSEDLVYLAGGERRPSEIADYPKLGKMMVRVGTNISIFETANAQGFSGYDKVE
jgi:uncharacterized cupin superfamily protein